MKVSLSRKNPAGSTKELSALLSEWIGPDAGKKEAQQDNRGEAKDPAPAEYRPIEPESGRLKGPGILKWILFLLILAYAVISYYHVPILTAMGNYLILEDPLKKADLIVCTPGPPLEQSLTAAELYHQGLAPRIFIPQEAPPAGLSALKEQGGHYPEASGLFMETLTGLNVPESACIVGNRVVDSVWEEAEALRNRVLRLGIRSMIVVTSASRSRRTYRVFKHILDGKEVTIMMSPSRYSGFKADSWWKRDRTISDAVTEYQKLVYYAIRGIW